MNDIGKNLIGLLFMDLTISGYSVIMSRTPMHQNTSRKSITHFQNIPMESPGQT
jgi:hypothetical protein